MRDEEKDRGNDEEEENKLFTVKRMMRMLMIRLLTRRCQELSTRCFPSLSCSFS